MSVTISNVVYNGDTLTFQATVQFPSVPSQGTQAARIADLLDIMGVNLFPIAAVNTNPWGSWPSDDTPATVVSCMQWLGIRNIRAYYNTWRANQFPSWLPAVVPQIGAEVTICIGATGSSADVPGMLSLAAPPSNGVAWLEGVNEPNNPALGAIVPMASVLTAQQALQAGLPGTSASLMGPSIIGGLPIPDGWFTGFMGASAPALLANMKAASLHLYPPTLCDIDDGSGRGGAFDDYVQGAAAAYPGKAPMVTEWHPTLFSGSGLTRNVLDTYDPLYALTFLLSAHRLGVKRAWYYALHDFGTQYLCGLFKSGATDPRPVAYAIRALNILAADTGVTRSSFTPGALAYTVAGLPGPVAPDSPHSGGQHRLFQGSDGKFRLLVWNAQVTPGGQASAVTVSFQGQPPASVTEYNLTKGDATSMTGLQTVSGVSSITSQLAASVHLFVITP